MRVMNEEKNIILTLIKFLEFYSLTKGTDPDIRFRF